MHAPPAITKALRACLPWLSGPKEAARGERVVAALTSLAVAIGLFLRARGYLWAPPAFWLDECTWAMNLVEQPLLELCIRPIGFMALSRILAQTLSLTEPVLRAMPWLAGMSTVLMAPPLARRVFENPAARLLFVFVIALHPCAIDFSKEFKPYSVSLTLHVALMLLALEYLRTQRGKSLAWLLVTAVVGGLFAQDLIFAYPGVFLTVGWSALHSRREHLRPILVSAALILLLLLLQYFLIWRNFPASETNAWGDKYNVFYTGQNDQSYGSWWLQRQRDLAAFPGFRRKFWHPHHPSPYVLEHWIRPLDRSVWVMLELVGVAVIALRRRRHALLLILPLATLAVFNLLRLWPLGVFRANVFVVVYSSGIACMAFDLPARAVGKIRDAVPALVLVLAPLAILDPGWSDRKQALTYASEFPNALKTLIEVKLGTDSKHKETLILDRRSCDPFRFYTQFHPTGSKHLRRIVRRQFEVKCIADDVRYRQALLGAMPRAPHHVWTMLHAPKPVRRMIRKHMLKDSELTYEERVGAHTLMAFWEPEAPPPPPKRPPPDSDAATDDETTEEGAELPDVSPNGRF